MHGRHLAGHEDRKRIKPMGRTASRANSSSRLQITFTGWPTALARRIAR